MSDIEARVKKIIAEQLGVPESDVTKADLLKFLEGKIAKWWMPDDVQFIDAIPHGATGKILKTALRKQFEGYKLPA